MKLRTLLTVSCWLLISFCIEGKEISLTFDDAPLPGSSVMSGTDKTARIIEGLKSQQVEDALFFVTTGNIRDEKGVARLNAYSQAGFHLGHHSHSHSSLNKLEAKEYLLDFYRAHLMLQNYENVMRLHRFPFLHYGEMLEKRRIVKAGLDELDYQVGYVTVDNFDWYLNGKFLEAHSQKKSINYEKLKEVYISTIWQAIEFYDNIALKSLKQNVKHVLLLHENELAALFIGDLVEHIKRNGWKIISPREAYTDELLAPYKMEYTFNKQGRVAAIAHNKGVDKSSLRSEAENKDYLDDLLKKNEVFK
ncbi:polysaccharide deacetylase [Pseudoalteromonas citrea]|uniref:Polysaccharide deacetylase n=1 Tax=Pseudoalteromonas citrea TaxID=43655 RepID=A0A5S3XQT3_9GAMM|nr:polysaccharide deacetylase family protein [Pseudoalteromonas citrea]TMP43186.1 polysaccharide deacetylase [Pseudoalteromonas citrea]TMP58712.1 polysaccharide deacetylase [Pseudoalteromonas citrea]